MQTPSSGNANTQQMTFQTHLEKAIHTLADEFLQAPYTFFTEANLPPKARE
ncbi:MAG: hypothetical protein JXA21_05805 [Anaerolineae bacterium]|nr:hypothetical protein [Anaerolineae bacterium]